MPCDLSSPLDCKPSDMVSDLVGDATSSAWESICKSFAEAAVSLLKSFAEGFAAFPNVDLSSNGVRSVYSISLGIAVSVAAVLMLIQIARTVITHDGNAFAQAFIGLGKAGLAFLITLTAASTALVAADGLTAFIIQSSFGSPEGLTTKLTTIFELSGTMAPSLMLLLAVIGIVLVLVLWFEMLLRNAAIAVLIGTSPIAAVGQISELTRQWWSQLVGATVRLIILKPVIALVFAVGFGITGNENKDLGAVLAGMLILLLAGLAWPAIARFFTFAAAHTGGPAGLAAVLGYGAGRAQNAGSPGGVSPEQFGRHAEARTMNSFASRSAEGAAAGGGEAAAGAGASAGAGATAGAGAGAGAATAAGTGAAAAAGPAGVMALALIKGAQMAQQAANSMVGRMEQTAGHAGLSGATSFARPAGQVTTAPLSWDTVAGTTPGARAVEPGGSEPAPAPSTGRGGGAGEPPLRPASVPPVEPTSTSGPSVAAAAEPVPPAVYDPGPAETSAAEPDRTPPPQPVVVEADPTAPSPPPAEPAPVIEQAEAAPAPEPAPPAATAPAPEPAPPVMSQPVPQVPQPRTASPVEHVKPAPSSPVVEHVKPAPSHPIEHTRPTNTPGSGREKGSNP